MQKENYILILLLLTLFTINYSYLDALTINFFEDSETGVVTRIVDGDTIKIGNETIRFLGINTPEKGEKYYNEAKNYLESLILNKTVKLEFSNTKKDKYGRTLAYIFLNNRNINSLIVQNGFANIYFPTNEKKYYNEFSNSWKNCLIQNKNLCKTSSNVCKNCIELDYKFNPEKIILRNICNFDCDLTSWNLKDEGRKKFIFPKTILKNNSKIEIIISKEKNNFSLRWDETYILTKTGDNLFLRDSLGDLVLDKKIL